MLIRHFVTLLCSGTVLAAPSAIKSVIPADFYDSGLEAIYDESRNQAHFGAKNQEEVPFNLENDFESDSQWPPHPPKEAEERTIYQVLSDSGKFTRLVKLIDISEEIVSLLNDTSAGITFFAPPDRALRPPHHRKRHHGHIAALSMDDSAALLDAYTSYDLADISGEIENIESSHFDDDKERRKKFLKVLLRAILAYHVLPQGVDLNQLTQNTTHATNLTISDSALDKEPLRIRVGTKAIPPSVSINFYSKVVKSDVRTKNGVIHVINHPLLPPPSIFQELFLAPGSFGAITTAAQRVGLTEALEWRYVASGDKKWSLEGTGSTTFFVPSNSAFKRLPTKLRIFLFSPFGEKVLKKLLQFHVVPEHILHSDYLHNATSGETVSVDAWTENTSDFSYDYSEEILFEEDFSIISEGHFNRPHDRKVGPRGRKGGRGGRGKHDGAPSPLSLESALHPHLPPPPPPPPRSPHGPHGGHPRSRPRKGDHCPHGEKTDLNSHKPVFAANVTLPTLTNHTLDVHVAKFKYSIPIPGHKTEVYVSKLFVNNQRVVVADVPARNGAVHVISKVLNPHHPHKPKKVQGVDGDEEDEDGWEDWEDWLLQWAEE